VITLAVDAWMLKQLLTWDVGAEDLEDAEGVAEPDDEMDRSAAARDRQLVLGRPNPGSAPAH
jgi:hypothetical protein